VSRWGYEIDAQEPKLYPYTVTSPKLHPVGMRQQLTGFFADLHVDKDTEYIGYLDGDSMFTTYVDREDLFENGNPNNFTPNLSQTSPKNLPEP
jgi:hypothetical protein